MNSKIVKWLFKGSTSQWPSDTVKVPMLKAEGRAQGWKLARLRPHKPLNTAACSDFRKASTRNMKRFDLRLLILSGRLPIGCMEVVGTQHSRTCWCFHLVNWAYVVFILQKDLRNMSSTLLSSSQDFGGLLVILGIQITSLKHGPMHWPFSFTLAVWLRRWALHSALHRATVGRLGTEQWCKFRFK